MSVASTGEADAHRSTQRSALSCPSFQNAIHEVTGLHKHASSPTPSPSVPSICRCVDVYLRAERLSTAYPSLDTFLYGKRKDAFIFRDGDEDNGFVFGSKKGEYCVLRIRIENSPESPSALVDSIIDVQMVYQCGGTLNPKIAETQSQSHLKEVLVLMEPNTLERRVTSGSPTDIVKAVKRDTRFQLHVQVSLTESDMHADIAKMICWRTGTRRKPLLWQRGYSAGERALTRLALFQCPAPKSKDATRHVKNRSEAHRKNQHSALNPELFWRTSLDSVDRYR